MAKYEVGVQGFTHETVEADSHSEAIEKAKEKADLGKAEISDAHASKLED